MGWPDRMKSLGTLYLIGVSWAPAGYCLTTFRPPGGSFDWQHLTLAQFALTSGAVGLALLGQFTAIMLARAADSTEELQRQLADRSVR